MILFLINHRQTNEGITIAASIASSAIDIADISVSFFTAALENIATLRAENGATMTRLQFAEDHLRLSSANLEAANSRIMDVDVATESTALAKFNILSQASAAMLAQVCLALGAEHLVSTCLRG